MNGLTLDEIKRASSEKTANRILCENCGHSLLFNRSYIECNHCHHLVFKNNFEKEKYEFMKRIRKERRNLK